MGNKGAFITLTKNLKPKYTTYAAVVSTGVYVSDCECALGAAMERGVAS